MRSLQPHGATQMKLNLGSGNVPLKGYTNVDLVPPADIVGDFLEMTFSDVEVVEMSHVLEHLPFRQTVPALERVRSWMVDDGALRVEVPDVDVLRAMDPAGGDFQQWWFGSQGAPGEFHCAGFNATTLQWALERAGWHSIGTQTFTSDNFNRVGYPCVSAVAFA